MKYNTIKNESILKNQNRITTYDITEDENRYIKYSSVNRLIAKLQTQDKFKNKKIYVRGISNQLLTIMHDNIWLTEEELEEYYNNKSQEKVNTNKFKQFSKIQITVYN